ncbi:MULTISPECIES: hypothetical protein [unclassified Streptococcus]|uniref:hypothetical protein n=1 Tax=unclassified Streptococcus TaxID=2608887 RepID=UPI00211AABB2|nr:MULTISPECIES: hypothetical protein [unclassified Streptococcus]MCQ9212382.1 hypothetical protein [Streptococcus sp. B01]MCQ9213721.1 hypothetical protein [Streptococcus sp. O1]MCQ9214517.1 hypothetical protein [Streptococcus sp. O1]
MIDFYIVRGVYLTAVGQESEMYYFKLPYDHEQFEQIDAGDICLSYYQSPDVVTSIPALIRVDKIITDEKLRQSALIKQEEKGILMLPIVAIFEHFDPLLFSKMMDNFKSFHQEVKELAQRRATRKQTALSTVVQGDLFDLFEEEER